MPHDLAAYSNLFVIVHTISLQEGYNHIPLVYKRLKYKFSTTMFMCSCVINRGNSFILIPNIGMYGKLHNC